MNKFNGRVYEHISTSKLLRLKSFFLFCKFPPFVKNMEKIYRMSSRVIGQKNLNKIIKLTYGDIFVGGETAEELEACLKEQKLDGLLGIADYAREFLKDEEENVIYFLKLGNRTYYSDISGIDRYLS